ncbi:hypothetical protein PIB30_039596 [Stylosanthes scabra]|uniref:Uncharacterized protein n=1 Tax=Stylosanthes scabra TaxID=79078 RepID=A0ABU6YBQ7_9FABA|nr:hypothetical protein [Stylosanthes scabra]
MEYGIIFLKYIVIYAWDAAVNVSSYHKSGVELVWMDNVATEAEAGESAEAGQATEADLHHSGGARVMKNSEASVAMESNGATAEAENNKVVVGKVSSAGTEAEAMTNNSDQPDHMKDMSSVGTGENGTTSDTELVWGTASSDGVARDGTRSTDQMN